MVTNSENSHLFCRLLHTVEPRFNEWARDWKNVFAITWFRYIEGFFHISHCYWGEEYGSLYRGLRYLEGRYVKLLLHHNKYSMNCLSCLGEDSLLYLIVISSISSCSFPPWVPPVGAVMISQAGSHVISISYQLTRLMTTPWPRFLHPSWTGILPKDSMRPSEDWERWACKQNWVLVTLTRLCRLDIVAVDKIDS